MQAIILQIEHTHLNQSSFLVKLIFHFASLGDLNNLWCDINGSH